MATIHEYDLSHSRPAEARGPLPGVEVDRRDGAMRRHQGRRGSTVERRDLRADDSVGLEALGSSPPELKLLDGAQPTAAGAH